MEGTNNPIRPNHYKDGKIEPIEYIHDHNLDFDLGNAVKYISRAGKKEGADYCSDLRKAIQYLQFAIQNYYEKHGGD